MSDERRDRLRATFGEDAELADLLRPGGARRTARLLGHLIERDHGGRIRKRYLDQLTFATVVS